MNESTPASLCPQPRPAPPLLHLWHTWGPLSGAQVTDTNAPSYRLLPPFQPNLGAHTVHLAYPRWETLSADRTFWNPTEEKVSEVQLA